MQVIVYLFSFFIYIFPLLQPSFPFPGNGSPRGPWPGPDPGIPITESIILLVSAGIVFGIKSLNKNRGKNH